MNAQLRFPSYLSQQSNYPNPPSQPTSGGIQRQQRPAAEITHQLPVPAPALFAAANIQAQGSAPFSNIQLSRISIVCLHSRPTTTTAVTRCSSHRTLPTRRDGQYNVICIAVVAMGQWVMDMDNRSFTSLGRSCAFNFWFSLSL